MTLFFAFVVGIVLGSFGNVLILRFPKHESIGGRSRCPQCHHTLAWYELIPVLSYVLQGGHCRHCTKKISRMYPIVELLSGAVFVFCFIYYTEPLELIGMTGGLYMLLLIAAADAKTGFIPDAFTFLLAVFALVSRSPDIFLDSTITVDAFYGLLLGGGWFLAQWLVSKGKWVGSGDILLAAALGLWLGLWTTFLMLITAYSLGGVVAFILLITGHTKMNSRIPFGPFLALATLLMHAGLWWPLGGALLS